VACDRATQTSPRPTHDQLLQDRPAQLVVKGSTQTLPPWTRNNVTEVPHVLTRDGATSTRLQATTSDMGTTMTPRNTTTRWTQMLRES